MVSDITRSVNKVMGKFPRRPEDLKTGSNRGDVLETFILSANYELLSSGYLLKTVETSTAHKVLMKIEDLVGNLHQNTIGRMRGNIRLPEPRRAHGWAVSWPYLSAPTTLRPSSPPWSATPSVATAPWPGYSAHPLAPRSSSGKPRYAS